MIEEAIAVAQDNAETARKAIEQRDALLKRLEGISLRLSNNSDGQWFGADGYDHLGNIEGWLEHLNAL